MDESPLTGLALSPRPARRTFALIAAAVLLWGALGSEVAAAPRDGRSCESVSRLAGRWTRIGGPAFSQNGIVSPSGGERFAVLPGDPNTIVVGAKNEIFRSIDGGCSWKKVFVVDIASSPFVDCRRVDDAGLGLVGAGCGRIYDVDFALRDGKPRLLAQASFTVSPAGVTGSLIYVSDDVGETWKILESAVDSAGILGVGELTAAPGNPAVLYVKRETYTASTLLMRSDDGGETWETKELPGRSASSVMAATPLVVSPSDPDEVWTTFTDLAPDGQLPLRQRLALSTDAGATWTVVTGPGDRTTFLKSLTVATDNNGGTVVAASDGQRLFYSPDSGRSWREVDMVPDDSFTQVSFGTRPHIVFAVGFENMVVRFDLARSIALVIKSGSFAFGAEPDASGNRPIAVVPGAGLYIFGECSGVGSSCFSMYRYTGRGAA